jgi:hypothetical protein
MTLSCRSRAMRDRSHVEIVDRSGLVRVSVSRREGSHGLSRAERSAAGGNLGQVYAYVVEKCVALRAIPGNADGSGGGIESDGGIELMSVGNVDGHGRGPGVTAVL